MSGSIPASPAGTFFAWPLHFAELALEALRGAEVKAAPDVLAQDINPWTININSNNSSAPDTEQSVLARHSYGRQLGRVLDAVNLLIEDLEAREGSVSGDERIKDFRRLKTEIDDIKTKAAERRLERIDADLNLLRRTNERAYRDLKEPLRDLVRD